MTHNILIVDDEADIRNLIQGILQDEGYNTFMAENSTKAFEEIDKKCPDLLVLDIWLQGSELDGLEILAEFKKEYSDVPVIMISGHGTIETAVSSIKEGAYDFIEKPFKSDRLLLMIKRALETAALKLENKTLKQIKTHAATEIVGESDFTKDLKDLILRVGHSNSRILITGPAGAGKDVVARAIHRESDRADKPFLTLSCANMHPERLEQELFGSATATAEDSASTGFLEQANGGTLLLDEISDMPLETQGKIVRVLQEQKFQKIGGTKMMETDVRIFASSNRDLKSLIEQGRFREDLFYRLNVVPIDVKPLNERSKDVPLLVEHFIDVLNKESGLPKVTFSRAAMAAMRSYNWPGNVRQLRNVVEWALIMSSDKNKGQIDVDGLPPEISSIEAPESDNEALVTQGLMNLSLREAREMFEREYLEKQVERFDGNVSETAKFVGMERSALHRKLKSLKDIDEKNKESDSDKQKNERKRA